MNLYMSILMTRDVRKLLCRITLSISLGVPWRDRMTLEYSELTGSFSCSGAVSFHLSISGAVGYRMSSECEPIYQICAHANARS